MTVDVPTKYQDNQNIFCLQTAPEPTYAVPIEDLAKQDIGSILKDIRSKIYERSNFGIRALQRIFRAMDAKGDHRLDPDDFRWGLMDYGLQISKEESVEIMNYFDKNNNGSVDFEEFLSYLKVSILSTTNSNAVRRLHERQEESLREEGLRQA